MPILALLLATAAPVQTPQPNLDTNICLGPCPVLPNPNLRPLAFLVGSCWRATLGPGGGTDTHCFTWMSGGHFLRDRRGDAQGGLAGEMIFRWDPAARQIRWDYYSSRGRLGSGSATSTGHGVVFAFRSSEFGPSVATRVEWRRDGANAYVETSQFRERGRWRTEPDPPRFQRVGPAPPD
jgi:hypothetical protein